jgi:antitoxin ParD1/3/4
MIDFLKTRITSGRYGNASQVVRESLRLLEQRDQEEQARLDRLRGAVKEGLDQLDRGEGLQFRTVGKLEQYIDQLGEEASAELASGNKHG